MAKKEGRFKGKVNSNRQRRKDRASGFGHLNIPKGVRLFKEEGGTRVRLDFVPYIVSINNHPDMDKDNGVALKGEPWYKLPYAVHRNVGSGNDTVVCPSSLGAGPCPICEYRTRRVKEKAPKEELKALGQKWRNLYCVIPIGHKEFEEEIHIWDISDFLFQQKLDEELDDDPDIEEFPDPQNGLTLRVRFTEETIGDGKNKYSFAETSRIDFEEREEPYGEAIMDEAPCLDKVLVIHSYEKLEAMFYEMEGMDGVDADDDDDDNARPAAKGKGKVKTRRPQDDDDDDDDDDDKNRGSSRKRKIAKDDDDDDASDEDDDEADEITEDDLEKGEEVCVACEGTRKNSKGRPCPICKGKGKVKKEAKGDDDDDDDVKERRPSKDKRQKKKKASEDECPYGYAFGTDCEEHKECDECDKWSECIDAKEKEAG